MLRPTRAIDPFLPFGTPEVLAISLIENSERKGLDPFNVLRSYRMLAAEGRGWINHQLLADALRLNEDELPMLAQTVGFPNGRHA